MTSGLSPLPLTLITPRTPTNPAGGLKFVDHSPLESTYINRKGRTKLLVVGVGKGLADRYFWPSRDAARQGHLPGGPSCKSVPKARIYNNILYKPIFDFLEPEKQTIIFFEEY